MKVPDEKAGVKFPAGATTSAASFGRLLLILGRGPAAVLLQDTARGRTGAGQGSDPAMAQRQDSVAGTAGSQAPTCHGHALHLRAAAARATAAIDSG